ncbi:MAG: hypothetical protein GXP08_02045 [Gammaproteobacteria bacterium]|nr:hypothetical protein [Gammaproteobacteria bacterium]
MPKTKIQNITQIIQIATIYPASALPPQMHQAYPIPLINGSEILLAFLYSPLIVSEPGSLQLCPPSYIAYIDATSGKFKQLIAAKPSDFGLDHAINLPLGTYISRPQRQDEKYINAEAHLFQAYDLLLPEYIASNKTVEQSVKVEALDFLARLEELGESPLLPYYESLGKHFFTWLRTISV